LEGRRGYLLAAGVGSPITGHGARLGIIDDPVENWQAAQSHPNPSAFGGGEVIE
jgi:hypothetical protein